jgi:hypothetical protein
LLRLMDHYQPVYLLQIFLRNPYVQVRISAQSRLAIKCEPHHS